MKVFQRENGYYFREWKRTMESTLVEKQKSFVISYVTEDFLNDIA